MSGNTFGKIFCITTFGESHGPALGVVIDGCPAGLEIDIQHIQQQLDRRRPGQSSITTQRNESDIVKILSGVFEGKSTGTPICLILQNNDAQSKDYEYLKNTYRPGHADFTYEAKYGIRDYRGGGRSSARETAARVAAGAIAELLLKKFGIELFACVTSVGEVNWNGDYSQVNREMIEQNAVRCPDKPTADLMIEAINSAAAEGDTLGGIISCVIKNVPPGLGEPVFDKLHADLGKAMLSINAVHGFEYGSGFAGSKQRGSENNDSFYIDKDGKIVTNTNHAGGILGGISNGMDIYFNVAFKPVSTIMQTQKSVTSEGKEIELQNKGRHDACVVPRAVPIVEAMAAIVIADYLLRNRSAKI